MSGVPTSQPPAGNRFRWEQVWQWYWHHFMKGTCFHLPLVLVPAVLAVLPFNLIGEGFGVAQVIWYDDPWKRFWIGAALAMVALQALFISYLLWDRARLEGRLDSDPGPVPFRRFVLYTTGCLAVTLAALYGLWELIGWVGEPAASGAEPEPRMRWLEFARPGESVEPKRWKAWLAFGALPLGAAAVLATAYAAAARGVGRRLAALNLVLLARQWLRGIDRAEDGARGWAPVARRSAGVAEVLAVWATLPVVAAHRSPGSFAALAALTGLGVSVFVASVLADRQRRLSDALGPRAFFANLVALLVPLFVGGSFVLSTYGFWWAVAAGCGAVLAVCALAAALPGPAGGWLRNALQPRAGAPPEEGGALQLWPFVLLAGAVFFLPLRLLPSVQSPAPFVLAFLFFLLAGYGLATVAVRRAVAAALTALVFLGVLAGVVPYKYRFDGLEGATGGGTEGGYARPLDLRAEARKDLERQDRFDEALEKYRDELVTRTRFSGVLARLKEQSDLRREWGALESGNRVLAPRRPRDESLAFLDDCFDRQRAFRYTDWRLSEEQKGGPLVVVTVSGGGLRAAAWTFTVLRTLEERFAEAGTDFPGQVRIISGASGGMFGAAYYVATLPRHRPLLLAPPERPQLRTTQGVVQKLAAKEADRRRNLALGVGGFTLRASIAPPDEEDRAVVPILVSAVAVLAGADDALGTVQRVRWAASAVLFRAYGAARTSRLDDLYQELTSDHLTPIVKQQVFEDVPNLFTPWAVRNDRGRAQEKAWRAPLHGALDAPFARLRDDERDGRIPSLVFTPMMVEDGRRLIISNLDMRDVVINEGRLLRESSKEGHKASWDDLTCHSRDALELFRLFPEAPETFPLSTAVRMSASFPLLSPAVSLPVTPRRRVVDAGYYDNYGVNLAATWLMGVTRGAGRDERPWLSENSSSKVLFVQIRDGLDQSQRRLQSVDPEGSTPLTRAVEELTSPVEGLSNARVASSSFRNDALLGVLVKLLDLSVNEDSDKVDPRVRPYQVVNFEFTEDAALSWYLCPSEKEKVRKGMTEPAQKPNSPRIDYKKRVESVKRWWKGEQNPDPADATPPGP